MSLLAVAKALTELLTAAAAFIGAMGYFKNQKDIDGVASKLPGRDGRTRQRWYFRRGK